MKFKSLMITILLGIISTTFMGCGSASKSPYNNYETISGTVYDLSDSSTQDMSNNMNMSFFLSVNGKNL